MKSFDNESKDLSESFANDFDGSTTALLKNECSKKVLKNYYIKIFIGSFANESTDLSKSFANDFFRSIPAMLKKMEKLNNEFKIIG